MTNFFNLIYIKTNRFSDEKFCVGIIANLNGVPHFGYSVTKLNQALSYVNKDISKYIKRSFLVLENDVNKILKGEESMLLFDVPYSKKILDKLALKKRGVVQYSEVIELKSAVDFKKMMKKFVGINWSLNSKQNSTNELPFNKRFFAFVSSKKFNKFDKKYKLNPNNFPLIYTPIKVDLIKKESYYTVFQTIDFSATLPTIQRALNNFRLIRQSLIEKANTDGLGKGRYYLVYESQKNQSKQNLIKEIKQNATDFELLRMNEMYDKV